MELLAELVRDIIEHPQPFAELRCPALALVAGEDVDTQFSWLDPAGHGEPRARGGVPAQRPHALAPHRHRALSLGGAAAGAWWRSPAGTTSFFPRATGWPTRSAPFCRPPPRPIRDRHSRVRGPRLPGRRRAPGVRRQAAELRAHAGGAPARPCWTWAAAPPRTRCPSRRSWAARGHVAGVDQDAGHGRRGGPARGGGRRGGPRGAPRGRRHRAAVRGRAVRRRAVRAALFMHLADPEHALRRDDARYAARRARRGDGHGLGHALGGHAGDGAGAADGARAGGGVPGERLLRPAAVRDGRCAPASRRSPWTWCRCT